MLGIHWLCPKCIVKEKIHWKRNHYLYVTRHFDNGNVEMWAIASKNPYKKTKEEKYYLGKVVGDFWIKPKKFYNLDRSMIVLTEKLFTKVSGFKVDKGEGGAYTLKGMKKQMKEKKVYTREDFVKFGDLGQKKIMAKYGVSPVVLRWRKTKKLSTGK
jgi:hypothetical protein